jgi:hypothetical protein
MDKVNRSAPADHGSPSCAGAIGTAKGKQGLGAGTPY